MMELVLERGSRILSRLSKRNILITKVRWKTRSKINFEMGFIQPKICFSPLPNLKQSICCSLCVSDSPGLRDIHTTKALQKKKRERKPIVYRNKSKMKTVTVWKNMTVEDLADSLEKTVDEIFEVFLYVDGSERFDQPNSPITNIKVIEKTVKLVGKRFVFRAPKAEPEDESHAKDAFKSPPAPAEELEPRPPIVTIMGHVDHGKTTLLDSLRHSSIVETEFGGITQHIGAFEVFLSSGHQVTFLDTPGHAAFSAMRARGANVTDVVVLVVAADDGVLQQTRESAELAREANTPVVVAINKIDKPEANIRRCEESLINIGIQPESLGGDVMTVPISALKGTNLPTLVETLVTQAEMLNLKATRKNPAEGAVIESKMDPGKGKIATCIIQRGTLTKGAVIVAETSWAKVRNLFNSFGKPVEKALPGTPVQVIGWRESLPSAGSEFLQVNNEKRAREVIELRQKTKKKDKELKDLEVISQKMEDHMKVYKEQLERKREMGIRFKMYRGRPPLEKQFTEDTSPRLSFVLRGDVDGSIEALLGVLDTYESEECPLDLISYGVGNVTPNDVEVAKAFKGIIYTFNVPLQKDILDMAKQNGVSVHEHNIIYRLIEDLKDEISKRLPHIPEEEVVGEAVVQQEFLVSEGKKKIPVAGCRCVKGVIKKELKFKVVRDHEIIHEGHVASLRHLKKEVGSIKKDVECGIRFEDVDIRFKGGDSIICFKVEMVPQRTDWNPEGF